MVVYNERIGFRLSLELLTGLQTMMEQAVPGEENASLSRYIRSVFSTYLQSGKAEKIFLSGKATETLVATKALSKFRTKVLRIDSELIAEMQELKDGLASMAWLRKTDIIRAILWDHVMVWSGQKTIDDFCRAYASTFVPAPA